MITIIVSLRGRVITTRTFEQERIRIGRGPDNEVRIDNAGLSRQHAVIERTGRVYTVLDISQKNGVYLNGERVRRKHLNHGDTIAVGKFVLTVDLGQRMAVGAPIARPNDGLGRTIEVACSPSAPVPCSGEAAVGHLALEDGSAIVLEDDACVIGAAAECHLRLRGWFTPRRVALVVRGHGGFSLLNAGRARRVLLNGAPVTGRVWLRDADHVSFGQVKTRFRLGLPAPDLRRVVSA